MLRAILMFLPVFAAGLVIGAWALNSGPQPSAASADGTDSRLSAREFDHASDYERLEQMIDSLTEIVNYEVNERRRLDAELAAMTETLARLDDSPADEDTEADRQSRLAAARASELRRVNNQAPGPMSEQRFIEAGFAPELAASLKRNLDEIEMERLYLRDRAVREGWLGSSRYRDELRELTKRQTGIRDELSAEDYDRYLYATGRPNRVTVRSVLSGSPADQSGLRPGDHILSYDGQRVFSPSEIRRETTGGQRGALVAIEVLREGRAEIVYVPRGPLGVQMGALVTKP